MTRDLRTYTFEELRQLLPDAGRAVDFRISYVWIDKNGRCAYKEMLVAVGEGEEPLKCACGAPTVNGTAYCQEHREDKHEPREERDEG